MKKILFISLSLLIISLLASCKRDSEPTIYKGRLLEENSNRPVPNAKIDIRECKSNFDTGQLSCYTIDSTFTDREGNFSYMPTNPGQSSGLYFWINENKYYYRHDGTVFYGTGTVERDIKLTPKAWLDLRLVREAPFDEYCIAVLGPNSPKFTLNGCKGPSLYYQYEGIYQERGNDTLKIRWEVYYLNKATTDVFRKSIYLKGLDTTIFELKF